MSDSYPFFVTGIVIIDNTHFIKLSPNPVSDQMRLEFKLNGIYQLNLDLIDLNGKIIRHWKNQINGSMLYLSGFANGFYLAKISSPQGKINAILKLVKQ